MVAGLAHSATGRSPYTLSRTPKRSKSTVMPNYADWKTEFSSVDTGKDAEFVTISWIHKWFLIFHKMTVSSVLSAAASPMNKAQLYDINCKMTVSFIPASPLNEAWDSGEDNDCYNCFIVLLCSIFLLFRICMYIK